MVAFLEKHYRLILFFLIIWVVMLVNSVHNSYPDEFDNLLGGRFVLQGVWPYAHYFAHHAPMGYFLSAMIEVFSGQSFVRFRLISSFFFVSILIFTWKIFINRFKDKANFFLGYIGILAVASTYFWGHMFLADNLSAYFCIPIFGLLFLRWFHDQNITIRDLWIVSIFGADIVLTSTTFTLLAGLLYSAAGVSFFLGLSSKKPRDLVRPLLLGTVIVAFPYLLFAIYLLLTGSLQDFIYQNVTYNQKYYIYNYPGNAATGINPIRYAISTINNFINNYQVLLSRINGINFLSPFNITLAVGNAAFWIYLVLKRKPHLALFSFLVLALANMRSNPADSKVTDYQSSVYFLLTFFNTAFLFQTLVEEIRHGKDELLKSLSPIILALVGLLWFYNFMFLSAELWRMSYSRYMGQMPLIYDWPQVAPTVNKLVPPDHFCWVGPFEFEENFYLNCKQSSKYTWILPQYANSPEIMSDLLKEYNKNKPEIIVFNRGFSAFFQSSEFNRFFVDGFLNPNYLLLRDIPGAKNLKFKNGTTKNFNFDEAFNFRKDLAPSQLQKLLELGLLEERKD